jgi:hypothetical protein
VEKPHTIRFMRCGNAGMALEPIFDLLTFTGQPALVPLIGCDGLMNLLCMITESASLAWLFCWLIYDELTPTERNVPVRQNTKPTVLGDAWELVLSSINTAFRQVVSPRCQELRMLRPACSRSNWISDASAGFEAHL